ncbi:Uncharacterised protein [Pseudomonas aeruginosa]|nr:Uncharacterised protein [Pseudomonas aeruginosa]
MARPQAAGETTAKIKIKVFRSWSCVCGKPLLESFSHYQRKSRQVNDRSHCTNTILR